jgi:dihydropteroate synthase
MVLQCGRFKLDMALPKVMAILNLTEDSFSGDGLAGNTDKAVDRALQVRDEGADILDIGAESTRPRASPLDAKEEIRRLLPVVERLLPLGIPLSIDTMKPEVMRVVLAYGVDMINDVKGFRTEGAFQAVADTPAALCIMHMQGEPGSMQNAPQYENPVREVADFLHEQTRRALTCGISPQRVVLDPGFGFGKTVVHNLALLQGLSELTCLGYPILAGLSRKSMLGHITGAPVGERGPASVTAAVLAAQRGARILRVHDVKETVQALSILNAVCPGTP